MRKNNKITVLLVEDDEIDIESISRAFRKLNLAVELHSVKNGIEALDELYGSSKLVPDLIIVDINLPKMNGIEFLKQLRTDSALDQTKILILTTSDNPRDKLDMTPLKVSGYLMKPIQLKALVEACRPL